MTLQLMVPSFPSSDGPTLPSSPLSPFPELVKTAARRRARVLRVLVKAIALSAIAVAEAIGQKLVVHLLGEWVGVSES